MAQNRGNHAPDSSRAFRAARLKGSPREAVPTPESGIVSCLAARAFRPRHVTSGFTREPYTRYTYQQGRNNEQGSDYRF
jgi:hypothetical protein